MAADDPVSAELAAIREDLALMDSGWPGPPPMRAILGQHAPRLLAAVEAVLKPHQPGPFAILGVLCKRHAAHRHFSITSTEAADVEACPDCQASTFVCCAGCGLYVPLSACTVRVPIERELTRKDGTNGD